VCFAGACLLHPYAGFLYFLRLAEQRDQAGQDGLFRSRIRLFGEIVKDLRAAKAVPDQGNAAIAFVASQFTQKLISAISPFRLCVCAASASQTFGAPIDAERKSGVSTVVALIGQGIRQRTHRRHLASLEKAV